MYKIIFIHKNLAYFLFYIYFKNMQPCETCTICYEETHSYHALNCCDVDKKICSNCMNCLRSPLCPYCRNVLDEGLLINNIHVQHVQSAPETVSWASFMENELLINPYDPEFADSRILRRQIRRMRRRFISEQNRNNRNGNNTNRVSTRSRRTQRRQARQQLRNSVRLNNNQFDLQFELELL